MKRMARGTAIPVPKPLSPTGGWIGIPVTGGAVVVVLRS
jgi:hypothetical protein